MWRRNASVQRQRRIVSNKARSISMKRERPGERKAVCQRCLAYRGCNYWTAGTLRLAQVYCRMIVRGVPESSRSSRRVRVLGVWAQRALTRDARAYAKTLARLPRARTRTRRPSLAATTSDRALAKPTSKHVRALKGTTPPTTPLAPAHPPQESPKQCALSGRAQSLEHVGHHESQRCVYLRLQQDQINAQFINSSSTHLGDICLPHYKLGTSESIDMKNPHHMWFDMPFRYLLGWETRVTAYERLYVHCLLVDPGPDAAMRLSNTCGVARGRERRGTR